MSKLYTWDDVVDDGMHLTLPDGTCFEYASDMHEYLDDYQPGL